MRTEFWAAVRPIAQRMGRGLGFAAAALCLCVMLRPAPVDAQQLPNLTGNQLQQLQQQFGQSQNGGNAQGDPSAQQPMVLQPAVPRNDNRAASRLEQILSLRAGTQLRQFGYDQLGIGRAVTIPQTGAVQDDYILGPGDEIVMSLRGQENGEFHGPVNRNGQVVLPRLPAIAATGRSFASFREDLEAAVHRGYVATDASISIGRVRQISVVVAGEVNSPGQRLLTGLSSAVDAILLSGGVRKTGSLRNVRVQRGGNSFTVDLYSVLTGRGAPGKLLLADGDRIVVPPLGPTVAVTGLVRIPGIFELPSRSGGISVSALMSLAGGQEVRGRYRLSVLRILADGRSDMVQLAGESGLVRDSEVLFVQLGADQTVSQATLSGGLALAGSYPISSGTRLSEVLKAPGALGTSPYTPFGVIVRKDPVTLMPVLYAFTPVAVLAGREDQVLQSGDVIRIFSANENQLLTFIAQSYVERLAGQQNIIRNPLGQLAGSDNSLANSVSAQAGQADVSDATGVPANLQRQQILSLMDTPAPGSLLAERRAEQLNARRRADALQARQSANARQDGTAPPPQPPLPDVTANDTSSLSTPIFSDQDANGQDSGPDGGSRRTQSGPPLRPGDQYSDLEQPQNFTDQSVNASGFASNREVQTFGQLARQLAVDPLILINFLRDNRIRLDGAVRGPGYYFVGPGASLDDVVRAAGGTVNWADESGVEVISTLVDRTSGRAQTQATTLPLHQDTLVRYILHPGDQVRFRQSFTDVSGGSVTVQGEVRFAGSFPITRGERLSAVMARAGGLTNVAYPYGTVFLRKSVAQVEREGYRRAASEVQNQLVIALTRIGNNKIDPAAFASLQSFVVELRNQQAVGRISIVADPSVLAANPSQDPLLEGGDVIYIPQRPSTISVLGQVLQPGSYAYKPGETLGGYIARAGGYAATADESQTFIVLPDGSARRIERSWLSFSSDALPPGSAIVVPRDVTPLDLRQTIIDVSQIFAQFAVSIASVAVLSKQ